MNKTSEYDEFITVHEVAKTLRISTATIYRYRYAREWADKIRLGIKSPDDVPRDIKPYLAYNFPEFVYFGPKIPRLRKSEFEKWKEWFLGYQRAA